ncbi:MAG: hypothetical protein KDJ74_12610 [Notoacmeibacter sp.]|nr:hypothetical protein [Notoacmeibacter sp.]
MVRGEGWQVGFPVAAAGAAMQPCAKAHGLQLIDGVRMVHAPSSHGPARRGQVRGTQKIRLLNQWAGVPRTLSPTALNLLANRPTSGPTILSSGVVFPSFCLTGNPALKKWDVLASHVAFPALETGVDDPPGLDGFRVVLRHLGIGPAEDRHQLMLSRSGLGEDCWRGLAKAMRRSWVIASRASSNSSSPR